MARVTTVEKSLKSPGNCGKCNKEISKGQGYRWWQFRYGGGGKRIRCLDTACRPRQSELTSSDKLSRVYAVGEAIEDAVEAFRESHEIEDLKSALTDGAEQLREVAREYRDSAESMESGMNGNRMPMCDELEEKADQLEGVADEMESAEANLPERDEEENKDPDEMTEEEISKIIDEEGSGESLDDQVLAQARDEHDGFDEKSEEERKQISDDIRETIIEEKRAELKAEYTGVEDWVDEVAGEVEQFTSIEVG